MITPRGWTVAGVAVVFGLAARLLGISELYGLAAAAGALVVASVVFVRASRFRLEAVRELRPPRVHAGSGSRVELSVRNTSTRRSPVLSARDPFDGGRRWARFLLAPLAPGEVARAAYRLPTDERGVFDLGPLEVQLADPFGLATTSFLAAPATKLTVYPRVDIVPPLPLAQGNDPYAGADHATSLSWSGEDFYALREYETGDDLRRVHWPSTAKLDELMIRQDEMPWQGRATVVLDIRRDVHSAESLEVAVSAAASILTACWRRNSLVRLLTTDGFDSGFAEGHTHREAVLEHLAGVRLDRRTHLTPVLASLRKEGNGGSLAVVTTAGAPSSDLDAVARLSSRYGSVTLVLLERSMLDSSAHARRHPPTPAPPVRYLVRVTAEQPFAPAWSNVFRSGVRVRR
ncbi:MAG TPA: DUF58 domain-containing protein [Acidimicrobiales bacterium]|jgi:uncharacterized protein (DUF58 family)|nr:DUF58 domain-containing protein [Acidimicrobiales bacterium]